MNTEISVIILNFNSNEYTVECVNSIISRTSNNISYEIIVVDNGSNEETFKQLRSDLLQAPIILVRSEVNLGFSGGLQVGVNHSSGQYFFFLNNDCLFLNDVLSEFLKFHNKLENVGILGGQIYDEFNSKRTSFGYQPSLGLKLFGHNLLHFLGIGQFPSRKKSYKAPIEIPLVSGSGMFISKTVLDDLGHLDLNYFLYCEEEDLALRASRKSYKNYFIPSAKYIHFQGKSSVEPSINILERQYRSLSYFYHKNYGALYKAIIFRVIYSTYLFKSIRKKSRYKNVKALSRSFKISIQTMTEEGSKRRELLKKASRII